MSYRGMGQLVPPIEAIPDPWYQRKARELQRIAASTLGQTELVEPPGSPLAPTTQPSPQPPAVGAPKYAYMVGWGAVILLTAGIFYGATQGIGTRPVSPNRRRRTSRRRRRHVSPFGAFRRVNSNARRGGKRRTSKRRSSLRRYKALSASARSSMPQSSFALSGKRFPVKGPPGSSRQRDKWQAMQAIRYLNMGRVTNRSDYLAIRNAIIRKYGAGFWRSYDGPTWKKIQSAKRKRATTRRRRRPTRRRVAANARRTSRRRRSPEVDREIKALAGLKLSGRSADYKELVRLLRKKYGAPYASGMEVHARQEVTRLSRNARRVSKRRSSAKSRVGYALNTLRREGIVPKRAGLSSRVAASLARGPAGLYRVGKGKVTKYKGSTSLQGAMTSTRIAASASGETHWLVKVYRSGRPKVVVVRKISPRGKTAYRVETAAQRSRTKRRRAVG